jgi:hypothetical protein
MMTLSLDIHAWIGTQARAKPRQKGSTMSRIASLFLIACLVIVPRIVQAQESRKDARVAIAKTACASGDVQQGIRLLAELYTSTNNPIWIFNQGRCYQQNDLLPQALTRFKEFLRKNKDGPEDDSREAQNYITEIEAELHNREAKSTSPEATSAGSAAGTAVVATAPSDQGVSPEEGRGFRYAGIGCFALGGASLVAGVVFTVLTKKASGDVESQTKSQTVPYSAVSGKFSDMDTYKTLQWVGYSVGSAAVIAGGVLYYFGVSKAQTGASASVAPLVVANGAGAMLHYAF